MRSTFTDDHTDVRPYLIVLRFEHASALLLQARRAGEIVGNCELATCFRAVPGRHCVRGCAGKILIYMLGRAAPPRTPSGRACS